MAYEAIQKVMDTEQSCRERKAEAAAQAKRILADAERSGAQAQVQARAAAQERVKALLDEAEQRAAARSDVLLQENSQACAQLRQAAGQRLEQAAKLIVEKVGNS